ncbi:MAG: radical SAM protein [Candidatus Aminicenantes bacterium]|nr:radical SAM protein [Candidatus Aminicenantes bacterium]
MPMRTSYARKVRASSSSLWRRKGPRLVRLDVELTERCNNDCIHCYINLPANDKKARGRELSAAEIKRILGEAADLGCLTVRFTGGEPLLRPDFEEIYLAARNLGMGAVLFTNACLLNPKLADLLKRVPPLRRIEVSVYGMTRASYERVSRAKGSYKSAWRGIRLLQERGIPFIVKGALLPPNREERLDFENWASSIPWMDGPPSYSMFYDLHCRRDRKKSRSIARLRVDPKEAARELAGDPRKRAGFMEFVSKFSEAPGNDLFMCGAGSKTACLDAYGTLYPCILLRSDEAAYDIRKGGLGEAMNVPFAKLRAMKASRPEYLARCARCFLKGLCEQCPAKSWIEHGVLDSPVEYFCDVAHALARELGLLKPDEKGWEIADGIERAHGRTGTGPAKKGSPHAGAEKECPGT